MKLQVDITSDCNYLPSFIAQSFETCRYDHKASCRKATKDIEYDAIRNDRECGVIDTTAWQESKCPELFTTKETKHMRRLIYSLIIILLFTSTVFAEVNLYTLQGVKNGGPDFYYGAVIGTVWTEYAHTMNCPESVTPNQIKEFLDISFEWNEKSFTHAVEYAMQVLGCRVASFDSHKPQKP